MLAWGLCWSSVHPENLLCWKLKLFFFTVRAPGRLWSQLVKHLRPDLPPEVYRFKREYSVGMLGEADLMARFIRFGVLAFTS